MPILTINIANAGTPVSGGGSSTVGHMWYSLTDTTGNVSSYGFAPDEANHGKPYAPGQVYSTDNTEYMERYYTRTVIISQAQYDAMKLFGDATLSAAPNNTVSVNDVNGNSQSFTLNYHWLRNSCIDYTWKAMEVGGLNPSGFEGAAWPTWNKLLVEQTIDVMLNNSELPSSAEVTRDSAGNVTGVTFDDGQGNSIESSFQDSGQLISAAWVGNDGSYGGDEYTYFSDGSYSSHSFSVDGSGIASTFDVTRAADGSYSQSWISGDGRYGNATFSSNAIDGSYSTHFVSTNGAGVTITDDTSGYADGSYTENWVSSDGSYGHSSFNADDGAYSVFQHLVNADGSSAETTSSYSDGVTTTQDTTVAANGFTKTHTVTTDENGVTTTDDKTTNANGTYTENWSSTDGSYGSAFYKLGGGNGIYAQSSIRTVKFNPDGTRVTESDSVMIGTTSWYQYNFDTEYVLGAENSRYTRSYSTLGTWSANFMVNYGDKSSVSFAFSNEGYSESIQDASTHLTQTQYANRVLSVSYVYDQTTKQYQYFTPVSLITQTLTHLDGSKTVVYAEPQSMMTLKNYDAQGHLTSDSWVQANGLMGKDTFNPDGSSSGITYELDGHYSTYVKDSAGNTDTIYYDANGNKINEVYTSAPPPSGPQTYTVTHDDGSKTVTTDDGQGNVDVKNYDAQDHLTSDSWQRADGRNGSDTFNADGSSSGTVISVDGTYVTYSDDGQGNRTTSNYDADDKLVSSIDTTNSVIPQANIESISVDNAHIRLESDVEVSVTGTGNTLDVSSNASLNVIGDNNTIAGGVGDTLNIQGSGNTLDTYANTIVNDGTGNNTVAVYGSNVTVNASSNTINLDANVSLNVNGNNNVLNGGEGDLIGVNGSGNVVNAYHNTQITDANGGNTIAAYGNHIQANVSGDIINVGANNTLDVIGSNNTVNGWIGDTLNISGTDNMLTVSDGTEVTDTVGGNTIISYEDGADITLSISGDTINVGSNNTLELNGSHNVVNGWVNDVFNVTGDANEIVLYNGTQLTNSGTGSTFINYGDSVHITDAGSNNTILDYASVDSHLNITASGDTIYVNANHTVNIQGAGNTIIAGANDVLTLVDTGAGNTVYANAGVTVTVDANSSDLIQSAVNNDILTLSNGSINVSGNDSVMSLGATNLIAVNADGSFSVTTQNADGEVTQSAQFNHDGSFIDTFKDGDGQTIAILTDTGIGSREQFLVNLPSGYASIIEQFSGDNASGNITGASILETDGDRFDFTFSYDATGALTSFAETGINADGTAMSALPADVGVAQLIQAMAGFAPPTAAQGSILVANQKLANQALLAAAH